MEHPEHLPIVAGSTARPVPDLASWVGDIRNAIQRASSSGRLVQVPYGVPEFGPRRLPPRIGDRPLKTYAHMYVESPYPAELREQHIWWLLNCSHRDLHPTVNALIHEGWEPAGGLASVILECPRVSDDGERLSYVQSEDKGRADRWTVTSVGKYIKSRWPYLRDDYIRDLVARYTIKAPEIWYETVDFVRAVERGPSSCMKWGDEDGVDYIDNPFDHPYCVYAHKFGWRMVVRKTGDQITSRCIVLHESRGPWQEGETLQDAVFVRSYRRNDSGYSTSDNDLEAWLTGQGARKVDGWPFGAKLRKVDHPSNSDCEFMAPYIDGEHHHVEDAGSALVISRGGEYECRNTDGGYESDSQRRRCECCGSMANEDDGIWVGQAEDEWVGDCCVSDYTYVRGYRRRYYVHNDDAVEVRGCYYHDSYLADNGIVELSNGDYEHTDYAFLCPIDDEWYSTDDAIYTEDEGPVYRDNAWQCAGSGGWYSTGIDPVEIDGETYHPDHAPDDDDETAESCEHTLPLPVENPPATPPTPATEVLFKHQGVSPLVRYRRGAGGFIDVNHGDGTWRLGAGERNEYLSDPSTGYYVAEVVERETA